MSNLDIPIACLILGAVAGFVFGVYFVHRFPRFPA